MRAQINAQDAYSSSQGDDSAGFVSYAFIYLIEIKINIYNFVVVQPIQKCHSVSCIHKIQFVL